MTLHETLSITLIIFSVTLVIIYFGYILHNKLESKEEKPVEPQIDPQFNEFISDTVAQARVNEFPRSVGYAIQVSSQYPRSLHDHLYKVAAVTADRLTKESGKLYTLETVSFTFTREGEHALETQEGE